MNPILEPLVIGAGIITLWVRWGVKGIRAAGIHELLRALRIKGKRAYLVELAVSVVVWTILATVFTQPRDVKEAFMTGLTCTGILAGPEKRDTRKTR